MEIRIKRAYEAPSPEDGRRILVDRLWPRGVRKADARIDFWARELAPSGELRRWYDHEPAKWPEFKRRYFAELDGNGARLAELREHLEGDSVTLVFSSRERELNNAAALKEYLEREE